MLYGIIWIYIMPFRLKNASLIFQKMMIEILGNWIEEFVVIYIDDIIIYSKIFKEHLQHIRKVLEKLKKVKLMLKLKKCKWCEQNIEFLRYIVGKDGLKSDLLK